MQPIPRDAYVELNTRLIAEGNFIAQLDDSIKKLHLDLIAREQITKDTGASGEITAKIKIQRAKGTQEMWDVTCSVVSKMPGIAQTTIVKGTDQNLICQPTGSSDEDPSQMPLFDYTGAPLGVYFPETGELIEPKDVAGKVGHTHG